VTIELLDGEVSKYFLLSNEDVVNLNPSLISEFTNDVCRGIGKQITLAFSLIQEANNQSSEQSIAIPIT